jgi:hypothetical protein
MGKRRPRTRPAEPITAQSLRELFARHVLRGRLKMPADAELKELARILEGWRLDSLNEQDLDPYRKLQDEALASLKTLSDVVSKLEELDNSNLRAAIRDSAPAWVQRILGERAMAINAVRRNIVGIEGSSVWNSRTVGGFTTWKAFADAFRLDFVNAMKPANPTFAPQVSHRGPLARFFAAVAPVLTGEYPTPGSVATQLKALRKTARQAHLENPRRLSARVK